jgi:N-acyl-D-amino-acid deacylase
LIIDIQKKGGASCVFFQMTEDDTENLLKLDYNMVASDGSVKEYGKGVPHCRNYGSFPRIIRKYVKEKKILSLPNAVRKMSSLPAQMLRLNKRGLIKEDMYADLVVFDLEKIKDTATYKDPHQYPEGISYVIVNGIIAAEKGKPTGTLPGKVLYGPGREK